MLIIIIIITIISRYHLRDVIVGKIYFLLVRIKIKYMELTIIKRETVGGGTVANIDWERRRCAGLEEGKGRGSDLGLGTVY